MRNPISTTSVRTALALAATLWLSGCAMLEPKGTEVAPSIPAQWNQPSLSHENGSERSTAEISWREFLVDPRMQQVVEQALINNRDLRVAVANVEKARAQYRIQRADRVPSLAAQGQMERRGGDVPVTEQFTAGLGVTAFELDLFGRVRNLSQAALQQYLSTSASQRATQLSLVSEVANAWLTLAADRELLEIAKQTLATREDGLRLVQRRYDLGDASALELSQNIALVETARSDAARFEANAQQDINALLVLAGGPVDAELLPATLTEGVTGVAALPAGVPGDVLLHRPDIMAAEHQLLSANANIGAARAAFFPSISLTGSVGSASTELSGLFDGGTRVWSFVPTISIPIFQGGRLRAGLGMANADRDIALAQYEKSIQVGFQEVSDALVQQQSLGTQLQAQEALVAASDRAESLSQARYEAGLDSFTTLLDARRSAYAARQSLVSTRLAEQSNQVTLYKQLGGGWH